MADPDVTDVTPIYIELSRAQIRVIGKPRRPIRVIAAPIKSGLFNDPEIEQNLPRLSAPGTALLDRHTRSIYGFATDQPQSLEQQSVELLGRSLRIVASVDVGTDFANDGTVMISDRSFAEYFYFRGGGDPLEPGRPGGDPDA